MAEDTKYIDDEPVSIYFYVDKETGIVDAIFTFNLVASAIRRNNTWDVVTRQDPEFDKYINGDWDLWKLDWGRGEDENADLNPDNESEWDPKLIQIWDKGDEIGTELLEQHAHKIEENNIEHTQE